MKQNPQSFIVSPNMLIIRDQKILLLRRAHWAPAWASLWHGQMGKMVEGETPRDAAIRETYEEVGVHVNPSLGTIVAVKTRNFQNPELIYKDVSLFFVANEFEGEPYNREPRLHDALEWFDINHLPQSMIPVVKFGIEQYLRGEIYGEFGEAQNKSPHQDFMNSGVEFRMLLKEDIPKIVSAFAEIGWDKPASLYQTYLEEQEKRLRCVWIAFKEGTFAGYVTLKWQSEYLPFKAKDIPEISDLNVLPELRKQKIASQLLDLAESEARKKGPTIGIGVGLSFDYGNAQRLYIRRGYVPDRLGVTYGYKPVAPGGTVPVDDDLVLWFTKRLV